MSLVIGWLFRWFTTLGLWTILKLFSRWEVIGRENIPRKGPVILASNHLNMIDPPLLATCTPRYPLFLTKRELLERPFWGYLFRHYGGIPVDRFQADLKAIHEVIRVLKQGRIVVIFPEGTRSREVRLQKGHPGVALIAMRSGAPVVPVAISGSEVVKVPGIFLRVLWLRPKVRIVFGKPMQLPSEKASGEQIRKYSDIIMERIAELLPEPYRGEYAYVGQSPLTFSTAPERSEVP
jgi:1-acyl-sn-glycerol-3-phosphate acyltransferase